MKKYEQRMEVFKKLNEWQLKSFVKDLTYRQYLILFASKYWTYDELRSLFASMEEDDSKRFFNEMTNDWNSMMMEVLKDLTYRQYLILFASKYWTYDELRSLFASMEEDDSKRFFNEMTNEQYEVLLEMMMDEEKS